MSSYNGQFDQHLQIVIKSDNHDTCLEFKKQLKKAIDPWFFQLKSVKETKSANKGDVLSREIQLIQTAYAPDIIVFSQMLKNLIWHYNLMFNVKISISTEEVIPENSRRDLLR